MPISQDLQAELCSWFASGISLVSLLPAPTVVPSLLSAFGLPSSELWAGRLEIGKPAVVQLWHFLIVSRQMCHGGTRQSWRSLPALTTVLFHGSRGS